MRCSLCGEETVSDSEAVAHLRTHPKEWLMTALGLQLAGEVDPEKCMFVQDGGSCDCPACRAEDRQDARW